jgi:hypothetical protein
MKTVKPHLLESSTDASEFLVKNRSKIKLFMTYMHATSFIQLREVDNQLVRAEIDGGPRLFFSEYDALTSAELRRLPNKLRLGNETMFTEQPLVILNACETGVAPYSPLANVHYTDSLPIVMIKLGARAVVATDAPVFKLAAAHFGEMLSKHLLRGVRGPQAVWLARKELLAKGNAVGLLYSFYGDPQVRVRIGP